MASAANRPLNDFLVKETTDLTFSPLICRSYVTIGTGEPTLSVFLLVFMALNSRFSLCFSLPIPKFLQRHLFLHSLVRGVC